jgi:hypothetical protein
LPFELCFPSHRCKDSLSDSDWILKLNLELLSYFYFLKFVSFQIWQQNDQIDEALIKFALYPSQGLCHYSSS